MVVSDNEDIIRDVHISPYENKMGTSLIEVWELLHELHNQTQFDRE